MKIGKPHEIQHKSIISSYHLGEGAVYTFGQVSCWPVMESDPEYYDYEDSKIIRYTYQVVHSKVDGDIDDTFTMEFDNLVDAMNLHHRLYNLSLTDEHKAYFNNERKKKFDEFIKNGEHVGTPLSELLNE